MAETESDSEREEREQASEDEVGNALEQVLSTVHLRIMGGLFALSDTTPMKGVDRSVLIPVLEALGVGNASSAVQCARIEANGDGCYLHNGKAAGSARLAITERGIGIIKRIFTDARTGELDAEGLNGMVESIKALAKPDEPADADKDDAPPPKRARRSAAAASTPQQSPAPEMQGQIVLDASDDEDKDGLAGLQKRLKGLLMAHDAAIDQDALAELYGAESAKFYKENCRAPGADEAAALLRSAKVEVSAMTSLGQGAVSRAQISTLLRKVREVHQLPEMVKSLEERAASE